jgi:hypothetical protein
MKMESIFDEVGFEVKLVKNFALVRETLERMGIKDRVKGLFYPSCYCVEKEGIYKVVHFKEMFYLEGKPSTYNELDELRRNTIVYFLVKWELIEIDDEIDSILQDKIDILSHKDKQDFRIKHKFIKTRNLNGKIL